MAWYFAWRDLSCGMLRGTLRGMLRGILRGILRGMLRGMCGAAWYFAGRTPAVQTFLFHQQQLPVQRLACMLRGMCGVAWYFARRPPAKPEKERPSAEARARARPRRATTCHDVPRRRVAWSVWEAGTRAMLHCGWRWRCSVRCIA